MDNTLTKHIFLWGHVYPNHNCCSDIRGITDSLGMIHIYDNKTVFDFSKSTIQMFSVNANIMVEPNTSKDKIALV